MSTGSSGERPTPPIDELAELVLDCWYYCEMWGGNVPDFISAALMQAAYELGGSSVLVQQRPGCWEATHVQALAAGADYQLELDAEQARRDRGEP